MNVLSLFSGIGGMDLGLERAGMRVVAQCEIDPFCRAVLRKHWPNVQLFEDIRTLHAPDVRSPVDLIAGGFPCQDISVAGHGAGIHGERSGMWWEMRRLVSESRPGWVLVENVPALRSRGADAVLSSLEEIGYACWPLVVGAWAVGAPHKRDRIWIVAANNRKERAEWDFTEEIPQLHSFSWCKDVRRIEDLRGRSDIPEPLFRGASDGIPNWMDRIGAIGNAVVPQVVEAIGRQIMKLA